MAKKKTEETKLHEMVVGTGELAAIIGKSDRWIRQLTSDGILTQVSRGKYVLSDAIQDYIKHIEGESSDGKISYRDEKAEHERIKKEKSALELAEMQGKMHRSEHVEAVMNDMLGAFRQRIRAIPMRLAPELVASSDLRVIKGRLSAALDEALAELADYDPELFRREQVRNDSDGDA